MSDSPVDSCAELPGGIGSEEIPLFPLSGVLLPYGYMSLRIFERRYLDLVRDCMRDDHGFGVAWIRRGEEIAQKGQANPELGDWGTYARIVDWDQLDGGLLGISIVGTARIHLLSTDVSANGLMTGRVVREEAPPPRLVEPAWEGLVEVLQDLQRHPHIRRMQLAVDYEDAWQVVYTLIQILPLEEALKYSLLGLQALPEVVAALERVLDRIGGGEGQGG